jgi:outer membrane protein assembly factor BamB
MKNLLFLMVFVLVYGFSSAQQNTNWNQYLGPTRNAISNETGILKSWTDKVPKKLWEIKLGPGYGGASIYGDEVYLMDRVDELNDILRCIDFNTGVEKWNFSYKAEGEIPYPGSRIVPYVDKDFVWCVGPHGDFYCINKETQKQVWFHDIKEEFEAEMPNWGFSQSPLVYSDLVIVAPQGKKAGVVAFNKITGDLVWKSRALTGMSFHSSPTLGNYGGVDQVIIISPYNKKDSTQTHEVVSFDAKTGAELWKYDGLKSFATITPPTIIDDKRLVFTDCSYNDNYNPVTIMVEITNGENGFQVKELFKTEETGCKMHPPILFENHLYLNNNGRPNALTCLTMDGKMLWEKGSSANFEMGGIIMIDGLLVCQNGKNGDIHLVEPSPTGYKELGKASFFNSDKSQAWAPLAFAQGKLIVRDMEKMVCVVLQ